MMKGNKRDQINLVFWIISECFVEIENERDIESLDGDQ